MQRRKYILIGTLIPLLYLVLFMIFTSVDTPYEDQWDIVPIIEKSINGNLTFNDLFSQHNEHRIFFPKLVMIQLAKLTSWQIGYELILNVILGIGICIILLYQIHKTSYFSKYGSINILLPLAALFTLSVNQWENWLWGFQMQIFMAVLLVILGIILITQSGLSGRRIVLAFFLGIIALYSFSNAIIFLILCPFVIIVHPDLKGMTRKKIIYIGLWIAASIILLASYLYGYHTPASHGSLLDFLMKPLEFICFILKYIGASLSGLNRNALVLGAFGIVVLFITIFRLIKYKIRLKIVLPYLAMISYSLLSAVLTGIGRINGGSPMSSRYRTISNIFWIGLIVLIFIVWKKSSGQKITIVFFSTVLIIIGIHFLNISVTSFTKSIKRKNRLMMARQALIKGEENSFMRGLYTPDPNRVVQRYKILKKHNLSIFKNEK
jgi:hypothetical protein